MTRVSFQRPRIPPGLRRGFPLASAALAALTLSVVYVATVTLPALAPPARLLAVLPVALASYRRQNWLPGLAYTGLFASAFVWQAALAAALGDPAADLPGAFVASFVLLAVSAVMRSLAAARARRETLGDAAHERGELLERATSLDQVARFVCEEAVADVAAGDSCLLTRNPVDDQWELRGVSGPPLVVAGARAEPRPLAAWLVEIDRELLVEDLLIDPCFEGQAGFRSLLARPLRNPEGTLIGILALTHELPGQFVTQDLRALDALVAVAETALGHASSYERSGWYNERLAVQLAAIQRTARELNAELTPAAIADRTLKCAVEIAGAERGAILVRLDRQPPVALSNNGALDDATMDALKDVSRWQQPGLTRAPDWPRAPEDRPGRIAAPIRREEREFGALVLQSGRFDAFSIQDMQAIASLASHAAVALENARLLQDAQGFAQFQRDLLATFSHELRAPLANITALAEVALADPNNKPPPEILELLKVQSRRLASLSLRALTAERLEAGAWPLEVRPLAVAALAREAAHRWQRAVPGREMRVREAEQAGWAWGDEDAAGLILDNLLENAVKHSAPGEALTVFIERRPAGMLTVGVEDCGEPIPEGERERIFERFYRREMQASRTTYGFGLGLYIVRQLSEAMGGRAWVEPAGEEGNRFAFCLPVMEDGDADSGGRG